MNAIDSLSQSLLGLIQKEYSCPNELLSRIEVTLNVDPKKADFGDINSNAALILAKHVGTAPQAIAQELINTFKHPSVKKMTIAGPGFINIELEDVLLVQLLQSICTQPETAFKPRACASSTSNIEFVSANPTGPLHFGHGRGGIIGDVLARVLRFSGQSTTSEFYINDAGSQIDKLGMSLKIRCLQQLRESVELPEDAYHGTYLVDMAEQLVQKEGAAIIDKPDGFFAQYAQTHLLARIKATLERYGISFDIWFSEKTLHESGAVQEAVTRLTDNGHTYTEGGALWFRSTSFGDDKDRVLQRADGSWTYAAADIAYLLNKASRGFNRLVMVLGQDHHSYATRLRNFAQALGLDIKLTIILYQLVRMKQAGELVQMSKRSGSMITLSEVIEDVGTDAARFFYLYRKAEAQLEFDLDLARKKSNENPVYYVQYAYVRTNSILEKALNQGYIVQEELPHVPTIASHERLMIRKMAHLEQVVRAITTSGAVHTLAYYAVELAELLHAYYNKYRVIEPSDKEQTLWRLNMVQGVRNTLAVTLDLLGLSKPEQM